MAKIPAVKGTRDFYPEVLAPIRRIFDAWRSVSACHGFEEWEGPTLEYLDLYREKSGEELVGQLYRLTDAGGRELALRPEMTPTLARMVAERVHALPKPIKWFCVSNLFRGENVQRGRLREFYQWNVDIIGCPDPIADAEVILVGVEALRRLGMGPGDFAVHISNRRLIRAILLAAGIPEEAHGGAYALMDKAGKLDRLELTRRWSGPYGSYLPYERLEELLGAGDASAAASAISPSDGAAASALEAAVTETTGLMTILHNFGISEFCVLDLHIVRGLAYYTGPVFEFYDRSRDERAICGGGRYDDLLGKLGKTRETAVGFGMGDVVLSIILQEKGLDRPTRQGGSVFVAQAGDGDSARVQGLVAALRRAGVAAGFSYTAQPLNKQLRLADKQGASRAVIVGSDSSDPGKVRIKDMAGGAEREESYARVLADPAGVLGLTT